jgi:hypothetical protein
MAKYLFPPPRQVDPHSGEGDAHVEIKTLDGSNFKCTD